MQQESLHISYQLFDDPAELPADEQEMLLAAAKAWQHAYAPFSEFKVGCAVQLAGGELVLGNNQENKAYPSGLCAERTALFHVGSTGKGKDVRKIAVRARSDRKSIDVPPTPCGACRQVMLEYEDMAGQPIVVLMQGEKGRILRVEGIQGALLPFGFDIEFR